jgi:N-acetyl sugar amidotransferase|tara:strand:+ start:5969 stop:7129 length:1161 start_codon:yes stop_codon:yes gene_type:complete
MDIKKKNVLKLYSLPEKILFCKKCTISNQRPRIIFDEKGVCSACNFAEFKKSLNWKAREDELRKLCDKFRKDNGEYDILIPCSGGKDGDYVAHQMKYEYGMNPLTVTWSPLKYTEIGRKNLYAFLDSGFNHVLGTPDPMVTKKLTELSFKHLGDPFQPFIYGQYNFPLSVAVQNRVSLIMYGENGEVEYGGDMKNAYIPNRSVEDQVRHYFSGISPSDWKEYGIDEKNLKPFQAPPMEQLKNNKTEIHFFSYYKYWDPQENFYYAQEHCNFIPNPERNEGTFSKYASLDDEFDGFHFYLAFIKFGIGRATSDSAHEIRDKKIDRDEGIALVKKYDGEFPKKYYKNFLEYCSISEKEFEAIIDSWRSPHIWHKDEKNQWQLNNPIWK